MTTTQLSLFPATQPPKSSLRWQGYTPDITDDEARAAFASRHGYQSQEIKRNAGAVLAGPIGKEQP